MKLQIFSIYDEKAAVFSPPHCMAHRGQILRAFSDLVQDPQTSINKHPGDYKLYALGEYDDCSGKLTSFDSPEFLAHATDYLAERTQNNG